MTDPVGTTDAKGGTVARFQIVTQGVESLAGDRHQTRIDGRVWAAELAGTLASGMVL